MTASITLTPSTADDLTHLASTWDLNQPGKWATPDALHNHHAGREPLAIKQGERTVGRFILHRYRSFRAWSAITYIEPSSRRQGIARNLNLAAHRAAHQSGHGLLMIFECGDHTAAEWVISVFPEVLHTRSRSSQD